MLLWENNHRQGFVMKQSSCRHPKVFLCFIPLIYSQQIASNVFHKYHVILFFFNFYPSIVTFNVVEHLPNKFVPVPESSHVTKSFHAELLQLQLLLLQLTVTKH